TNDQCGGGRFRSVARRDRSGSASAAAEDAAQRNIGGRRRARAPEAREFGVVAQLLVGERQLSAQMRTVGGLGELAQLPQPSPAPLQQIAITATAGGAWPKAAF